MASLSSSRIMSEKSLLTTLLAVGVSCLMGWIGCIGGRAYLGHNPTFGQQIAIVSPHDEAGGRFDGARVSPGFGILYRNGYTDEAATNENCGGFFGREAEHIIEVDYAMSLKLVAQSESAVVLGVVDPDGSLTCWDEDSISNANVSLERAYMPGQYEVWVGSTERHTSVAYRLVLSE